MKILVNAVALKVAGARAVLNNFLESISIDNRGHTYDIFLPADPAYDRYEGLSHMRLHKVPYSVNKFYFRYFIDHWYMPRMVKKHLPDAIFSMGNIALPIRDVPQLLLFHIPHPIYPENAIWGRLRWRQRLFFAYQKWEIVRKFSYAQKIAAQTVTAKVRLDEQFGLGPKTMVIPNAVSMPVGSVFAGEFRIAGLEDRVKDQYLFLCLSRYYAHKNLEILLDVAALVKKKSLPYRIVLTIDPGQDKKAALLLKELEDRGLGEVILNAGHVPMEEVPALYARVDALLLPTLIESFSGTYVEAAFYRKPVFTSGYDFARDVLGDEAVYFDPLNATDILQKMSRIDDTAYIHRIVERAGQKVLSFPTWKTVTDMYVAALEDMNAT